MSRSAVERRLVEVNRRLHQAREELTVLDHQLAALAGEADDARVRALVSDSPLDSRDHKEAQRHADAMARSRADVAATIAKLERTLDELLAQLVAGSTSS